MAEPIKICSFCRNINERNNQRYCLDCHNLYMRNWRKTHKLTGYARIKDIARHKANVYQRRGLITPKPCEVSGCNNKSEKHHDDYSKPLVVRWLCRIHHLELHNAIA